MINNALIQCDEAYTEISNFANHIHLDPERLNQVEERISTLHQIARKYHIEPNQLPIYLQKLKDDHQQLINHIVERNHLEKAYQLAKKDYQEKALTLRESRIRTAVKLENEISNMISQLGMPGGYIKVSVTDLEVMHDHGLDKVEYLVCTNPGMLPDTLPKVVSGGELSRIGLAIHMITAKRGATPTLIFDEVDVGIGGSTASLVGQFLQELGKKLQIFCVTHQAAVAGHAHHHFKVEKCSKNKETFSSVHQLTHEERISEIARMIGGLTITEQSLSHAKELLLVGEEN